MNEHFLVNTNLFRGLHEDELHALLECFRAREKTFQKGETIYRAGDVVTEIGLVESGSVNIVVNFYWGGSQIFGHIEAGQLFAETYAAIPGKELLSDVIAAEECEVLFLNLDKLLTVCSNGCAFHNRIIHNLIRISAGKNLNLSTRMMHTAPKSIRDRLMSYFSEQAQRKGSRFAIPFSRQQLADYLGVDRSAMSNELSKMQRDGLLTYHKNEFVLSSTFHTN